MILLLLFSTCFFLKWIIILQLFHLIRVCMVYLCPCPLNLSVFYMFSRFLKNNMKSVLHFCFSLYVCVVSKTNKQKVYFFNFNWTFYVIPFYLLYILIIFFKKVFIGFRRFVHLQLICTTFKQHYTTAYVVELPTKVIHHSFPSLMNLL